MQKIKEFLSKGVSPVIAIAIVAVIAVIIGGGILAYVFLWQPAEPQMQDVSVADLSAKALATEDWMT
ncbi:MAG: hypothetical protein FJZ07_02435 [Candidatus Nealsonbacteria bacterium]|nr:hypothetical protein [Candidatus Nealsonbacteria bacterium]